jgi:hypothetical protein
MEEAAPVAMGGGALVHEEMVREATGEDCLAAVTQLLLREKGVTGFEEDCAVELSQLEVSVWCHYSLPLAMYMVKHMRHPWPDPMVHTDNKLRLVWFIRIQVLSLSHNAFRDLHHFGTFECLLELNLNWNQVSTLRELNAPMLEKLFLSHNRCAAQGRHFVSKGAASPRRLTASPAFPTTHAPNPHQADLRLGAAALPSPLVRVPLPQPSAGPGGDAGPPQGPPPAQGGRPGRQSLLRPAGLQAPRGKAHTREDRNEYYAACLAGGRSGIPALVPHRCTLCWSVGGAWWPHLTTWNPPLSDPGAAASGVPG